MSPQRIQLRRTKGWRLPEGAIVVARPSKWGNPFPVQQFIERGFTEEQAQEKAVAAYAWWMGDHPPLSAAMDEEWRQLHDALHELRGYDLACWCPLDAPCHADVLLELANRPSVKVAAVVPVTAEMADEMRLIREATRGALLADGGGA